MNGYLLDTRSNHFVRAKRKEASWTATRSTRRFGALYRLGTPEHGLGRSLGRYGRIAVPDLVELVQDVQARAGRLGGQTP